MERDHLKRVSELKEGSLNTPSERGEYFRGIYADLLVWLPEFPTSDPTPNLPQCIHSANFVRAEMLARQHRLPSDVITRLREMAVLQHIREYESTDDLERMMERFKLGENDIRRILVLAEEETTYPLSSFSKATAMAVDENWSEEVRQRLVGRPSLLCRLVEWIRRLFGKNRAS